MKIVFVVILLFFWSSIGAQVRPEYSGMWYNPDQDGHGLSLEVLDAERSAGFWYRYDESGEPEWWLLQGTNHSANAEFGPHMKLAAYRFHGMISGIWDPATNTSVHVTDVMVEFHDCNNITVYDVWAAPAIDMIRLTHIAELECEDQTPMPTMLEHIASAPWLLTITGTEHSFVDITVASDGTFQYGGGSLLCNFEAQLSMDTADDTVLYLTHLSSDNDEFCLAGGLGQPLVGKSYTNYEVCLPNLLWGDPFCADYDEALVFMLCEGGEAECNPDGEGIVLHRTLD